MATDPKISPVMMYLLQTVLLAFRNTLSLLVQAVGLDKRSTYSADLSTEGVDLPGEVLRRTVQGLIAPAIFKTRYTDLREDVLFDTTFHKFLQNPLHSHSRQPKHQTYAIRPIHINFEYEVAN